MKLQSVADFKQLEDNSVYSFRSCSKNNLWLLEIKLSFFTLFELTLSM